MAGMPGFRLARPTPAFDVSAFSPEIQEIATERPEFASFMQEQMQVPGFQSEWQQSAQRKPTRDRGAEIELQERRLASFQAAYDRAVAGGDESVIAQAQRNLHGAQGQFDRETGASFPVYETYTGTRYDPKTQRVVEAERTRLAQDYAWYQGKLMGPMTRMGPTGIRQEDFVKPADLTQLEGETTEAFARRQAEERGRIAQNLADMAKMKTTAGLTQQEFFEKQLPGFERRFEASPFFQEEQERLEREKEIEEAKAEAERRRATSRRAVTVFGRRQ